MMAVRIAGENKGSSQLGRRDETLDLGRRVLSEFSARVLRRRVVKNATLPLLLLPSFRLPGDGIPDLNGVWEMPYTPDLERPFGGKRFHSRPCGADKYKNSPGRRDPHGYCQPTGPPRAFHLRFPFQLVQSGGNDRRFCSKSTTISGGFSLTAGRIQGSGPTWSGDAIGPVRGEVS